jgi:hypothetical protein
MRWFAIAALCGVALLASPTTMAEAKGCLKGAAVGGVAGHLAGHHGMLGAAAGCAVGHHEATKEQRAQQAQKDNDSNAEQR